CARAYRYYAMDYW
nr:immunoglobulin heavy chain junction region [Mus musculus]MBK4197059.1 immunoglobulin heavy chain junction region [Mus musculus]MBK4197060.1 immunoglobulin heavy chain junction region [Mus musculus]MBK4197061.1 immunoglobulin heavy chain junction region [Mus musculus]MBK4197062.1 immunoglobulin heavy chain junction region [Mus musculus]